MFLSETDQVLISKLKGRVSKILCISSKLQEKDREQLESVFSIIDKIILSKEPLSSAENAKYRAFLIQSSEILMRSNKVYIHKHILPLINRISTKRWGKE